MLVSATVRVRTAAHGHERPDRARLEEAARLLEAAGFHVLRIGRFGIGIRGDDADFLRVLGVNAAPGQPLSAAVEPSDPGLRSLIDLIEILPHPTPY